MKRHALLALVIAIPAPALLAQTSSPSAPPVPRRASRIAPPVDWAKLKAQGVMRRFATTPSASVITRDAAGHVTKVFEPDAQGKPTLETDITYNPQGKVSRIVQHGAAGDAPRERGFTYDAQSRVISATSPEAGTVAYTYDANGNIASKTDAQGHTVRYTWDAKRRLTGKTYTDGSPAVHLVYDAANTSVTAYRGTPDAPLDSRVYHYDAHGRLTSLAIDLPGGVHALITPQYDPQGRLTGISYPDGTTVTQTWTSDNRLDSVSSATTRYLSTPTYSATGTLTGYTLGDKIAVRRVFDATHHLSELSAFANGQQLLDKLYSYTPTGDVEHFTDKLDRTASFDYAYDALDRITGAEQPEGDLKRAFDYDAFGDRASSALPGDRQRFDAANRFAPSTGLVYDAVGEMTFDGRHHYAFDDEGYIASVDGGAVTYEYDAEGNRVAKRTKLDKHGKDNSAVTGYVWFDGVLLAERRPDGTWIDHLYAYGNRIASTATHADPATGTPVPDSTAYFLTDTVGLTRTAFAADGTVLTDGDFAPFGTELRDRTTRAASGIGSAANISFTGEVHDDETGLDAYKFRSYNPQLGRWMSPDPSSLHFSNLAVPQTFNLYAYVTNDPLKYIDIDGLTEEDSTDPSTQLVSADGTNQDGGGPAGSDGATMTILYSPDGGGTVGGTGGGGGSPVSDPTYGGSVDVSGCDYDACVTATPDPPPDPTPSDPIFYNPALPDPANPVDPANSTVQQREQAAENQAKQNMLRYAANPNHLQPGDNLSSMSLSATCSDGNNACTYTLTGIGTNSYTGSPNTYYVWEHQTSSVLGGSTVGSDDFITPSLGDAAQPSPFDDTLGGWALDSYRFFTVSTSPVYNPSLQMLVNIQEGGQLVGYEHIFSTGGPVYINGSTHLTP